ncbi:MAG: hypothetical protein HY335_02260 [Deinococcus sp.]|nr:hypothetical protein [Deinococcus sp.]
MDTIVHHHELEKSATLFPWIVEAADAISAARPGARRETSDLYMERLRALEAAAASFPAVQEVHAIDGGRNLQVFVNPSRADDTACAELARQIAQKVEAEVHYPGQVQVTVVRSLIATAQAAQWGATGEEPPNKGRNGNGRLLYPRRSLAELALGPEVVVQLVKGAEATPAAK